MGLRHGRGESDTSATIGHRGKGTNLSVPLFKPKFKFRGIKIILSIVFLASVLVNIWLFWGRTYKQETTIFVEDVQKLATLATAEAHVKTVIKQTDNKIFGKDIKRDLPGTKQELLLIVPATVVVGVDLNKVSKRDMKINEKEKELEIVLPPAEFIQDPAIQMDQVITYSEEGLFRQEPKWDEGYDFAAQAQQQIKEEVKESGLLKTAEKNAEKVLKEFFRKLGYSVKVSIK
ncbi:DUF4230 domain-containing protein [Bacillus sp. DNRA2]|uniref:DUF4230 domain-containing protein n=1 Tax=Bacillus sp. DNRA2 TaxID=2723053 RepID=UPI002006DE4E|nr:DUF4230 domain-containing protein [Bacillus sp. DNRA2]